MVGVDELVRLLEKRYGDEHTFDRLTLLQRQFLLDHSVAAYRDETMSLTVLLQQIEEYQGFSQVSILDVFRYQRKRVKTRVYATQRLQVYKERGARRVCTGHLDVYVLKLPDESIIKVEFMTLPDGVSG